MMPGVALPVGLSLALILAEPVLRAHPERHVLPPGIRVAGDVPVTARRAKVAAGPRHPPSRIAFPPAAHPPLHPDITASPAVVLHPPAPPATPPDPPPPS